MKHSILGQGILARTGWCGVVLGLCLGAAGQEVVPGWSLVWQDEFDGPDGSAPGDGRWTYDIGGTGWGNQELQYHTNRRENSRIEAGHLVIEARREFYRSGTGTWDYTSARLKTQGRAAWTYGRFEARIKLPAGEGLWPAFWMLGTDYPSVGWPDCGEIDIMENIGSEPFKVHASAHGPGYSGASGARTSSYTLQDGTRFSDGFHLFAIDWEPEVIRWSMDNRRYFMITPASLPPGRKWVFDHPFFIILNTAVGGVWPGDPSPETVFPQRMLVDYVRVYTRASAPPATLRARLTDGRIEVRWPVEFPHARLQRSERFRHWEWTDVPITGTVRDGEFVHDAVPGYYRLYILP